MSKDKDPIKEANIRVIRKLGFPELAFLIEAADEDGYVDPQKFQELALGKVREAVLEELEIMIRDRVDRLGGKAMRDRVDTIHKFIRGILEEALASGSRWGMIKIKGGKKKEG